MRHRYLYFPLLSCVSIVLSSCRHEAPIEPVLENSIPEFFKPAPSEAYGKTLPGITVLADYHDWLDHPQDLDFNPTEYQELWIINKGSSDGGSTVIIKVPGEISQRADYRKDEYASHCMQFPSSLAFSSNGNWASATAALSDTFNGPALWPGDVNIFGHPIGSYGSFLDMMHQSPMSMGIASDAENVFWVFDGFHGYIARYDFGQPHPPGEYGSYDGKIWTYPQAAVKKYEDLPSHMVLDKNTGWLYVVSAADRKIYRLNTNAGHPVKDLDPQGEKLAEYKEMAGALWEVFLELTEKEPCGIDINGDRLFISDYATGNIIAFDKNTRKELGRVSSGNAGVTGIKINSLGRLYLVNSITNQLLRIDPK
jgi:hypothetical protein